MYLTPARLPSMRLGISLAGIPDIDLASLLEDARAITDSYCNVPLTPQPYSFLGATIVDEQFIWKYPKYEYDRVKRRLYPKHWPVRSVTSLSIVVGANASAAIPADSLIINNKHRWVEVTSLAIASQSGLFGASGWIVPIGGLQDPIALLSYESGFRFEVTDERLWPIAEGSKTYQGSFGWWIANAVGTEIVITDNGTIVADSNYTVSHDDGQITFGVGYTINGTIRGSYWHKLPREIERAQGYLLADLLGNSKLRAKGFTGLDKIKAGEIELTRSRTRQVGGNASIFRLEETVPEAATLLGGYRFWSIA